MVVKQTQRNLVRVSDQDTNNVRWEKPSQSLYKLDLKFKLSLPNTGPLLASSEQNVWQTPGTAHHLTNTIILLDHGGIIKLWKQEHGHCSELRDGWMQPNTKKNKTCVTVHERPEIYILY